MELSVLISDVSFNIFDHFQENEIFTIAQVNKELETFANKLFYSNDFWNFKLVRIGRPTVCHEARTFYNAFTNSNGYFLENILANENIHHLNVYIKQFKPTDDSTSIYQEFFLLAQRHKTLYERATKRVSYYIKFNKQMVLNFGLIILTFTITPIQLVLALESIIGLLSIMKDVDQTVEKFNLLQLSKNIKEKYIVLFLQVLLGPLSNIILARNVKKILKSQYEHESLDLELDESYNPLDCNDPSNNLEIYSRNDTFAKNIAISLLNDSHFIPYVEELSLQSFESLSIPLGLTDEWEFLNKFPTAKIEKKHVKRLVQSIFHSHSKNVLGAFKSCNSIHLDILRPFVPFFQDKASLTKKEYKNLKAVVENSNINPIGYFLFSNHSIRIISFMLTFEKNLTNEQKYFIFDNETCINEEIINSLLKENFRDSNYYPSIIASSVNKIKKQEFAYFMKNHPELAQAPFNKVLDHLRQACVVEKDRVVFLVKEFFNLSTQELDHYYHSLQKYNDYSSVTLANILISL